jgi:putative (di)nucleoside polyphosphate hydrolase
MTDDYLYRRGAGIMLLNADRKVWVGRRIDNPTDAWQMPQGGLDEGEQPWAGALRELEEETGVAAHLVERLAECAEPLRYDLPADLAAKLWRGQWKGQVQHWFAARFTGDDSDVDIATEHPEFDDWKWADPRTLPDLIVPFKRELYQRLLKEFAGAIRPSH